MADAFNEAWGIVKTDFFQGKAKCPECGRVFDLMNEKDAAEWYYGHDCEA